MTKIILRRIISTVLFCLFGLVLPAFSQIVSFHPKDKDVWDGYTLTLFPLPFHDDQVATLKTDSISTLPSLIKTIDPNELFAGVRIAIPGGGDYMDIRPSEIEKDTLFVEHQEVLGKVAQSKNEKDIQKEMKGIAAKQLRKYRSGFIKRKINSNKLKTAILSGGIFERDSALFNSSQKLAGIDKAKLDSFYFEALPIAFDWKNQGLIPLYMGEAKTNQILISDERMISNTKHIALSIFLKTPYVERKSKLAELFNLIQVHKGDSFEGALALWYTYYFVKSGGLTFTNSNIYAYTIEEIYEFLSKVDDGLYKKSFLLYLESLTPGDLLKQNYTFRTINGDQIKISNLLDKEWVLLDFWATWCQPCIKAFPELATFYSENENTLNLLSLSVDNDFEDFSKWTKRNEQKYPWPFLSATQSHAIVTNLKVSAYPSYYLIKVKTGETIGPIHKVSELRQILASK